MNTPDFTNETILVVDDEIEICNILKIHFNSLGANVLTATTARDALHLMSRSYVDVIISDIRMSELGGFEFLQEVQKRKMHRRPFFLMSGHTELSDAFLKRLGARGFFSKPFVLEEMDQIIAESLGHSALEGP